MMDAAAATASAKRNDPQGDSSTLNLTQYDTGGFYDEMFDTSGAPRPEARLLLDTLQSLEQGQQYDASVRDAASVDEGEHNGRQQQCHRGTCPAEVRAERCNCKQQEKRRN